MKNIPDPLRKELDKLRERIQRIQQQYKSLANYGRPFFENVGEIAVIYYLNAKLNIGLNVLAEYLGVDKTTLYKVIKKVENEGRVSITNPETKRVEVISISPNELVNIVESEVLNITSRLRIADPFQSSIVKQFWESDVERQSNKERRQFYSQTEKRETIKVVQELMNKALELNDQNIPSNPDYWNKNTLLKLVEATYKDLALRRRKIKLLRRIPHFRSMLEGYVGAEKKYVNPRYTVLFYEDYIKIKQLWRNGQLSEDEFLIVWLHITTGAREGYSSGDVAMSMDIEDVHTSLLGLRWENLTPPIIKIYESKTNKWWTCDLTWLDPEPLNILLKYKQASGSIIKAITNLRTVSEFRRWYTSLCKKLTKLLGLQFILKPHDIRRSHLSILAELGVPLEIATSDKMDFGVGWEDLSTAQIFYLRFSKLTKQRIISTVRSIQEEIMKTLNPSTQ